MNNNQTPSKNSTKEQGFFQKHPVFSGLASIFSLASIGGFLIQDNVPEILTAGAFTVMAASPALCVAATGVGVAKVFEENRSAISKTFNTLAASVGIAGLIHFAGMAQDGPDIVSILTASFSTLVGAAASSTLNTVAHYTRNTGKVITGPDGP